jgi:hypothetical protein
VVAGWWLVVVAREGLSLFLRLLLGRKSVVAVGSLPEGLEYSWQTGLLH